MKKLFALMTALLFTLATFTQANAAVYQQKPAQHLKKDGTADKRYKENKHLKKDGTPDMRYNGSKKATAPGTTAKPAAKPAKTKK